jgi:hypothetical protein
MYIAVAHKGEASIAQIARDFWISETCLQCWLKINSRKKSLDPEQLRAVCHPNAFNVDCPVATLGRPGLARAQRPFGCSLYQLAGVSA